MTLELGSFPPAETSALISAECYRTDWVHYGTGVNLLNVPAVVTTQAGKGIKKILEVQTGLEKAQDILVEETPPPLCSKIDGLG